MDFAGIMQTVGIKGRYVGFTYIRPLYSFDPFWKSEENKLLLIRCRFNVENNIGKRPMHCP